MLSYSKFEDILAFNPDYYVEKFTCMERGRSAPGGHADAGGDHSGDSPGSGSSGGGNPNNNGGGQGGPGGDSTKAKTPAPVPKTVPIAQAAASDVGDNDVTSALPIKKLTGKLHKGFGSLLGEAETGKTLLGS